MADTGAERREMLSLPLLPMLKLKLILGTVPMAMVSDTMADMPGHAMADTGAERREMLSLLLLPMLKLKLILGTVPMAMVSDTMADMPGHTMVDTTEAMDSMERGVLMLNP